MLSLLCASGCHGDHQSQEIFKVCVYPHPRVLPFDDLKTQQIVSTGRSCSKGLFHGGEFSSDVLSMFSSLLIWSETNSKGLQISRKGVSGQGRLETCWLTALTLSCAQVSLVGGFVQQLINGFELHVKVLLSVTCSQKLIYPNDFLSFLNK